MDTEYKEALQNKNDETLNYFISIDNDKKGPLKLEELMKMNLTDKYFIWHDGLDSWKPIISIKELENHIIKTPPLSPREIYKIEQKNTLIKALKKTGKWFIAIFTVLFIIMGGFASERCLVSIYKHNDSYPIYAPRDGLRGIVFKVSLTISIFISFFILTITYLKKYKMDKNDF